MMDDEDDDFYDPADTVPAPQHQNGAQNPPADNYGEEYEEEEIEVDEDDVWLRNHCTYILAV